MDYYIGVVGDWFMIAEPTAVAPQMIESASASANNTLLFLILGILILIGGMVLLYRWFRAREIANPTTTGARAFFHPTWKKIVTMFVLGGFAFFGLMSCFVTDMRLPAVCTITVPLALLPMLIVEPIGDLIGGYDTLIILIAIVVVVVIYYTVACALVWGFKRIESVRLARGGQPLTPQTKRIIWSSITFLVVLFFVLSGALGVLNNPVNKAVRGEPDTSCIVDADCVYRQTSCSSGWNGASMSAVSASWDGPFCPFPDGSWRAAVRYETLMLREPRGYEIRAYCQENQCVSENEVCAWLIQCNAFTGVNTCDKSMTPSVINYEPICPISTARYIANGTYGPKNIGSVNLALGKQTTASVYGEQSHLAVDNDTIDPESAWVPDALIPAWWQVDLGQSYSVARVKVYPWATNHHDWYRTFRIEISQTGAFKGEQQLVVQELDWDETRKIDQYPVVYTFAPASGRYVRITGENEQSWMRLQELEVYGVEG